MAGLERGGGEPAGDTLVVEPRLVDHSELDCVLCCRTLWKPITTPCGHTYCCMCLDRCLDYSYSCPLCMTSLSEVSPAKSQSCLHDVTATGPAIFTVQICVWSTKFILNSDQIFKLI